jgi:hypothetical protein
LSGQHFIHAPRFTWWHKWFPTRKWEQLLKQLRVALKFNPHHKGAEQIIGTVKSKGDIICGSQLYDVEYQNPADGQIYNRPLGHHNLQATGEANLIKLAEHHETLATNFRALAKQAVNK